MQFWLDITPPTRTAQQKGESIQGGRIVHYVKKEVRAAETTIREALLEFRPPAPFDGPISLYVEWRFLREQRSKKFTGRVPTPKKGEILKRQLQTDGYIR